MYPPDKLTTLERVMIRIFYGASAALVLFTFFHILELALD